MSRRASNKNKEKVSNTKAIELDKITIESDKENNKIAKFNLVYEEFCNNYINENFNEYELKELKNVYKSGNELLMQYYISETEENNVAIKFETLMQMQYILSKIMHTITKKNLQENIEKAKELEQSVKAIETLSNYMGKQYDDLNDKQKEIEERYSQTKEEMGNLIYNILGFIASFSVISATVSTIDRISSLSGILLFMAFTIFLLLTTLIGLHNFYKSNNKSRKFLQNNYFLWKMMIAVIILLAIYKGVTYIKNNQQEILESVGRGIGQVINTKNKLEEN